MLKGFLKVIVMKELELSDHSGYSLMKRIEEIAAKKPSPGYIYPLLSELASNKYITKRPEGKRNIYSITRKGKKFLAELQEKKEAVIKSFFNTVAKLDNGKSAKENLFLTGGFKKHYAKFIMDSDIHKKLKMSMLSLYEKDNFKEKRAKFREIIQDTINKVERLAKE